MLKSKFKNNLYTQILSFIAVPAFFSIVMLISCIFICNNYIKLSAQKNYQTTLSNFCQRQEESIQNISFSFQALSENNRFIQVVDGNVNSLPEITYTQKIIRAIVANNSSIESVAIFERASMQVYTPFNVFPAEAYFYKNCIYSNYDLNYWLSFRSPLSEKSTLSPCKISSDGKEKNIIPIVFTRIGDKYLKNIIIVNYDISSLISRYKTIYSDQVDFFIYNAKSQMLFNSDSIFLPDQKLLSILSSKSASIQNYFINNQKHYVFFYAPNKPSNSYVYVAMIPTKMLNKEVARIKYILITILSATLLILVLLTFFFSKKAYSPFDKIIQSLDEEPKTSYNIESIYDKFHQLQLSNKNLSETLEKKLPIIKEQQLIRILNSSEHYSTDEDLKAKLTFEYDYFCSIIVRFTPKPSFYEKYDKMVEKQLELSLFEIVHMEFSTKFINYVIPSDEHTLYVLLNLPDPSADKSINEIIDFLYKILEQDSNDLSLAIANGNIYENLEGLKISHKNALKILSGTQWISDIYVKTAQTSKDKSVKFTQADENSMYNYLISGKIDDAIEMINQIIAHNTNISQSAAIRFYIQILNIVFKVMHQKNIEYDTENIGDISIINNIISNSTDVIQKNVFDLINMLRTYIDEKKPNVQVIFDYITENYASNISLDTIAEHFGYSPSHLSRLIKSKSGMTFTDYINSLRINEAQNLLSSTNESIVSIYERIGFNNRVTFTRLFKQFTGVTPSEYRKNTISKS